MSPFSHGSFQTGLGLRLGLELGLGLGSRFSHDPFIIIYDSFIIIYMTPRLPYRIMAFMNLTLTL